MSKPKKLDLEAHIALCEGYCQLWARLFNFFADGFENRRITGEDEARFFGAVTEAARTEFRLAYFLGEGFPIGDKILGFLGECISLSHIHGMSEGEFAKFQHDWHVIFIALNKCLGRLMEKRPLPKDARRKKAKEQEKPASAA